MSDSESKGEFQETIPVFLVNDIASTMQWYSATLGFAGYAIPETPPHAFGILSRDDVQIFLQHLEGYNKPDVYKKREGGVWDVYLQVRGVRSLYQTLSRIPDVTVIERLRHQEYGQTEFVIRDPNGYVLVLAERD